MRSTKTSAQKTTSDVLKEATTGVFSNVTVHLEDDLDVEEVEVSSDQEGLLAYLEDAVEVEWEDVEMDELV